MSVATRVNDAAGECFWRRYASARRVTPTTVRRAHCDVHASRPGTKGILSFCRRKHRPHRPRLIRSGAVHPAADEQIVATVTVYVGGGQGFAGLGSRARADEREIGRGEVHHPGRRAENHRHRARVRACTIHAQRPHRHVQDAVTVEVNERNGTSGLIPRRSAYEAGIGTGLRHTGSQRPVPHEDGSTRCPLPDGADEKIRSSVAIDIAREDGITGVIERLTAGGCTLPSRGTEHATSRNATMTLH